MSQVGSEQIGSTQVGLRRATFQRLGGERLGNSKLGALPGGELRSINFTTNSTSTYSKTLSGVLSTITKSSVSSSTYTADITRNIPISLNARPHPIGGGKLGEERLGKERGGFSSRSVYKNNLRGTQLLSISAASTSDLSNTASGTFSLNLQPNRETRIGNTQLGAVDNVANRLGQPNSFDSRSSATFGQVRIQQFSLSSDSTSTLSLDIFFIEQYGRERGNAQIDTIDRGNAELDIIVVGNAEVD